MSQELREKFAEFVGYNIQDVLTQAEVSNLCPPLSDYELKVWQLDQVINNRGVCVDMVTIEDCLWVIDTVCTKGDEELRRLTMDHDTGKPAANTIGQVQAIGKWVEANSKVKLPRTKTGKVSLTAEAVEKALKRKRMPDKVREVLVLRQKLGLSSVKKLFPMLQMADEENRVRGIFQYYGALRTGRWSGRGIQPHNLKKPGDLETVEHTFARFHVRNPDLVNADSLKMVSDAIRGMFVSAPGKELICSDYNAIEAVVLAEIAEETWRQEVFRTHGKIYEMSASKITGLPFEEFAKYEEETGEHHPYRGSIGKVAELACFAADTQVLTDRGWVFITRVKKTDKLFDGVEFVKHDGVIDKGAKDVINLHGVLVTPDHKFYMGGNTWKTAGNLRQDSNNLSLATHMASSLLCKSIANPRGGWSQSQLDALVEGFKNKIGTVSEAVDPQDVISALKKLLVELQNTIRASRISVYVDGYLTECALQSEDALIKNIRSTIRMVAVASRFTKSGWMTDINGLRICLRSLDMILGQIQLTVSTMTEDMNRGISDSCPTKNSNQTNVKPSGSRTEIKNTVYMSFISSLHQTLLTLTLLATDSEKAKLPKKSSELQQTEVYDIINAGPRSRFVVRTEAGPLIAHNSGFGGWINAWKNFGADKHFKTDDEIKEKIIAWRDESPKIVELWGGQQRKNPHMWHFTPELFGAEGAVVRAISQPGVPFPIGKYVRAKYDKKLDVLNLILPSGRKLYYQQPRLESIQDEWSGLPVFKITFMKFDTGALGWHRSDTYGGRLVENMVQAIARDLLADAMLNVEASGYPIVLHVHDEIVSEVPIGFGSIKEYEEIMARSPEWAKDWPVRASGGWRGRRYRK